MADKRAYDPSILDGHPVAEIPPLAAELHEKLRAARWPPGLAERVLALRRDRSELEAWLDGGFPTPEMVEQWLPSQEILLNSSLVVRQATWEDGELLSGLCADADERVGDWTVTVERGPNPFAQFRLQEHPNVMVLEDRRVALGMAAHAVRNTHIGGRRTTAHHMSGWRVRNGFRGLGLSKVLQQAPGPGAGWFGLVTYWFVRSGNASIGWISKVVSDMEQRSGGLALDGDAVTASVSHFDRLDLGRRSTRVRPTTEADAVVCIDLINRTHKGLDLFRPYTQDFFDERMNDLGWGPKPSFYPSVYGRPDHRVLEVDGDVVACGGLWDRGRDIRETWVNGDERFVVHPAALMDFGFAEGRAPEMVELLTHLLAEADELGRSGLLASLEYVPEVVGLVDHLQPTVETRELHVMPFSSPELTVQGTIGRPYVDLAYW
ncbi:MAG: hypothetical protein WBM50_09180 [Acidimicrobiales bacterium]